MSGDKLGGSVSAISTSTTSKLSGTLAGLDLDRLSLERLSLAGVRPLRSLPSQVVSKPRSDILITISPEPKHKAVSQ